MVDPSEAEDQLWLPNPAFPGEQTMIYRNSCTHALVGLSMTKTRRVMRVRAVLTDRSHPINCSLEDLLAFTPNNGVRLTDGPFSMWKHYGGTKAVFFDIRGDENGNLTCVEV